MSSTSGSIALPPFAGYRHVFVLQFVRESNSWIDLTMGTQVCFLALPGPAFQLVTHTADKAPLSAGRPASSPGIARRPFMSSTCVDRVKTRSQAVDTAPQDVSDTLVQQDCFLRRSGCSPCVWVNARTKQRFIRVDVAHSSQNSWFMSKGLIMVDRERFR